MTLIDEIKVRELMELSEETEFLQDLTTGFQRDALASLRKISEALAE